MDQRTQYLIQVLEKLGGPLMEAIQGAPGSKDSDSAQDAKTMAGLLSRSVEVSIAMTSALNITDKDGDPDAVRLALAAVAGPIIADLYENSGKVPEDAEVERITNALEAVLTFSSNFTPAAEHAQRLETLSGDKPLFDGTQAHIYTLHALIPVLNAITEFPFGNSETKLFQDVTRRLEEKAKSLNQVLSKENGSPLGELIILKTLAEIYAACHKTETAKLLSEDGERDSEPSLDPVWENFETRVAMLEAVTRSAVPGTEGAGASGGTEAAPPVFNKEKLENQAPAASEVQQPAEAPAQGDNPLSFFKKPKEQEASAPSAPPEQTPAQPPAAAQNPSSDTSSQSTDTGNSDSNPMAFFKPGSKKTDDNA